MAKYLPGVVDKLTPNGQLLIRQIIRQIPHEANRVSRHLLPNAGRQQPGHITREIHVKYAAWLIILGFTGGSFLLLVQPSTARAASRLSGISAECSKQADAKGVHGKARKHFRAECKRGYKSNAS